MRQIILDRADSDIIKDNYIVDENPKDILEHIEEREEKTWLTELVRKWKAKKISKILLENNITKFDNFILNNSKVLILYRDKEMRWAIDLEMKALDFLVVTKTNEPINLESSVSIEELVKIKYFIYKDTSLNIFYVANPLFEDQSIRSTKDLQKQIVMNDKLIESFVTSWFKPINNRILNNGLEREITRLMQARMSENMKWLELWTVAMVKEKQLTRSSY